MDSNTWRYDAFDEPQTTLCTDTVKVWIGAMKGDTEITRKSILVQPVHKWWTNGHKHGPNGQTHPPDTADFTNDYNFLRWKYAAVLATTGGVFAGGVMFSPDIGVYCGTWPLDTYGYACTNVATGAVIFGISTFTGSEN